MEQPRWELVAVVSLIAAGITLWRYARSGARGELVLGCGAVLIGIACAVQYATGLAGLSVLLSTPGIALIFIGIYLRHRRLAEETQLTTTPARRWLVVNFVAMTAAAVLSLIMGRYGFAVSFGIFAMATGIGCIVQLQHKREP